MADHTLNAKTTTSDDVLDQELDYFLVWMHTSRDQRPRGAKTYHDAVRGALRFLRARFPDLALADIRQRHIDRYFAELAGYSPSTRRGVYYGLKRFFEFLEAQDVLDDPTKPLGSIKAPNPFSQRPPAYDSAQLRALRGHALSLADQQRPESRRWVRAMFDYAVVATLSYSALRQAELRSLQLEDISFDERLIEVRWGKNGYSRQVVLPKPLVPILRRYLIEVRPHCPPSTFLFANPSGQPGTEAYGQFTARAVGHLVHRLTREAGLPEGGPHRLRHSAATDMHARGAQLDVIQAQLGHQNLETTLLYIHTNPASRRAAIDRAFADEDDHPEPAAGALDGHPHGPSGAVPHPGGGVVTQIAR